MICKLEQWYGWSENEPNEESPGNYLDQPTTPDHRITEGMVGRYYSESCGPALLLKWGHLRAHHTGLLSRNFLNVSSEGDYKNCTVTAL